MQKGSFWNMYKMMGIIKALQCCQNLYQALVLFSNDDPVLILTIFMTGSNVSWCCCMGDRLYSTECPSISKFVLFSISSALMWAIEDQWSSAVDNMKEDCVLLGKLRKLQRVVHVLCALCALGFKKDGKVRKLIRYITQRSIPVWVLTSWHTEYK